MTKIQSVVFVVIIIVAAISGSLALYLWSGTNQSSDTIKIGVLADLDKTGNNTMNGAILAAEEINAAGGVLGKQIEVIGEDSDVDSGADPLKALDALNRLMALHKVDFVLVNGGEDFVLDNAVEHKKIIFGLKSAYEALTQRVIDDYDRYKYFFRYRINETAFAANIANSLLQARDITGFNKIAYLGSDDQQIRVIMEALDALPETHGFDLVYSGKYPERTFDFTSYFARAEAAGAEIMVPLSTSMEGVALAKEWYERQSPMVLWGLNGLLGGENTFNQSGGVVEHMTLILAGNAVLEFGYQTTSKTLATKEAFLNRWGVLPNTGAVAAYDCVRFLLYDALERAQTTETEAVIKALEESEIENSLDKNFKFTSSHDHYFEIVSESAGSMMFQWQAGGVRAIVYPKSIMEETGATYTYPPWPGPWDE